MEISVEKNELPCGVILAILGVGVFLTIFLVNYPDESSSAWTAWAAWVQGFGSIGAIMAAYFLGERQAKKNERLQRSLAEEQAKQKRAAFYAIAESTRDLANEIDRIFTPNPTWMEVHSFHYDDGMVDPYVAALRAVPVHEIGSAAAIREFLALAEDLPGLKNCAKHWMDVRYRGDLEDEKKIEYLTGSNNVMKLVTSKIRDRVEKIHAAMYPSADAVRIEAGKGK